MNELSSVPCGSEKVKIAPIVVEIDALECVTKEILQRTIQIASVIGANDFLLDKREPNISSINAALDTHIRTLNDINTMLEKIEDVIGIQK